MALNLVATCDLVTIFQRPFCNLLYKIIRFSHIFRYMPSPSASSKFVLSVLKFLGILKFLGYTQNILGVLK